MCGYSRRFLRKKNQNLQHHYIVVISHNGNVDSFMGTAILPSTSQMQTCHHLASVNCLSAFKLRDRPFHMPWRCLIFLAWEKHEYLFMCVQYNSFLACWICCTLSHSICFENKNLHNGRPLVCNDKHHKYHVIECQTSHRKIKGKEPRLSNP